MIITSSALNNVETAITNPPINGIFIVNYNSSTNSLSHSFAQIKAQFQAGNLVLVKEENFGHSLRYYIIIELSRNGNYYSAAVKDFLNFSANSETSLLEIQGVE